MKRTLLMLTAMCLAAGCAPIEQHAQPTKPQVEQKEKTTEKPSTEAPMTEEQQPNKEQPSTEQPAPNPTVDQDLLLEAKYWNVIEVKNGQKIIMNPTNILALVNKEQSLPAFYKPSDLVVPNVPFSFSETNVEKRYLRLEAARALEQLFAAAKKAGISLVAVSGYRSYDRQKELFDEEVKKNGKEKAIHAVAFPGQSEHQTGLAIDISSQSMKANLTASFGETNEGKWVATHAHEYGFIIRYPKGKEAITGYQYEPWHIRYVGQKAAKVIYEKNITLEEYFQIVKKV
ncbi:D-alanyl-D-alanine carboxypeptidase family protein [Anoxybacillus amylolyticus]|uniref:D-alanyl-D-alanine carboxypeptidase family protein n=1 Tax=Anoxybacteroides amylolyticum TaxID=294699 RepID=A0A160F1T5_9BACL|nr:M15 family metallopeptidase [Anoxybacillus amylolyticus]ANB60146.1 D-alanyl-D-alanine carboxypeptidase family protein [Anoxybacillus amylolyticus]